VEGPYLESEVFSAPIKVKKVNFGTNKNSKMESIGDYWDEKIVERITKLLCEYNDLFPTTFKEMKGTIGELVEMRIHRPYKLNPVYK